MKEVSLKSYVLYYSKYEKFWKKQSKTLVTKNQKLKKGNNKWAENPEDF